MSTIKNFELLEKLGFGVIDGKPVLCGEAECHKCLFSPMRRENKGRTATQLRRQWLKENQKKEPIQKCRQGELVLIEGLEKRGQNKERNGLYVFGYCTFDGTHYFYKDPLRATAENGVLIPDLTLSNESFDVESLNIAQFKVLSPNANHSITYTKLTLR